MGNLGREEQEYASQSGSDQQPGEESSTRHGSKMGDGEMGRKLGQESGWNSGALV